MEAICRARSAYVIGQDCRWCTACALLVDAMLIEDPSLCALDCAFHENYWDRIHFRAAVYNKLNAALLRQAACVVCNCKFENSSGKQKLDRLGSARTGGCLRHPNAYLLGSARAGACVNRFCCKFVPPPNKFLREHVYAHLLALRDGLTHTLSNDAFKLTNALKLWGALKLKDVATKGEMRAQKRIYILVRTASVACLVTQAALWRTGHVPL
eukprot:1753082-Pleurochrysis_carterae.AAC.1